MYERRMLKCQGFNNKVDAGEIGAGDNITTIHEITRKRSASGQRAGFVQLVKPADGLAAHGHDSAGDTAAR